MYFIVHAAFVRIKLMMMMMMMMMNWSRSQVRLQRSPEEWSGPWG